LIIKVKNYILFLFDSFFYYLPQDRTIENTFNSYPIIKIASLTLSIILIILFIKIIYNSITKDDQSPNSNISQPKKILNPDKITRNDNDNKKNLISLKGRVKKIPDNVNYNEMFSSANLDNSQNLDEKSILHPNQNNLNIINKFFDNNQQCNEQQSKEIESNKKSTEKNIKCPLPRNRNDLLFFNELDEKVQEKESNIDYDLNFLKKEEPEGKTEEVSESEKLIIKLTNSGQFSQTEISKIGRDKRSFTKK